MRCFEILIAESFVSKDGGPLVANNRLLYWIPDEAQELLEPVLGPYGQNPAWYFDKLNFGRPPAPWAIVCLDREYAIGGHVATSRSPAAGIAFSPYTQVPDPMPHDFVPRVGVLVFASKSGLERSAGDSPLFAAAWDALRECASSSRWLALLDPVEKEWLTQVVPGDSERWLSTRGQ
jgi:hypothetical protein